MKLIEKLSFPKVKINYGVLIKYLLILFLIFIIAFGINFFSLKIKNANLQHDVVKGNIENLYYFLKKEPDNMELFAVLKKEDGVAVSVWENYLSTSDDIIKKYEKQIKKDLEIGKNYKEIVLYDSLKKALMQFKVIRDLNQERIESKKTFDKNKLIQSKKDLMEALKESAENSKQVGMDLR